MNPNNSVSEQFNDIMKVLINLQKNITKDIKPAIEKIDKKVSDNIAEMKEEISKNGNESDDKFRKIDESMNNFEQRMKRMNYMKVKANWAEAIRRRSGERRRNQAS